MRKANRKKINWGVRFSNPVFVANLVMAIILPIVAYNQITIEDLTTWDGLVNLLIGAISNPFLLAVVVNSVYASIIDPTTDGLKDSKRTLNK